MTKNCWNSQALAEISCYLAFAGAMLYLVRSGRYLSYVCLLYTSDAADE